MIRGCWLWLTAWPRGFVGWIHAAFCALLTDAGLKAWALLIAWGCSVAMTAYVSAALWLVRTRPMLVFWLGLCAMGIILIVITGIMVLLGVRRNIGVKHGDDSFEIDDTTGSTASPGGATTEP